MHLSPGLNRLYYKATGFEEGLTVTGELTYPDHITVEILLFDEMGGGLYYTDYDFVILGRYLLVAYEDNTKSQIKVINVQQHNMGYVNFTV